MMKSKKEHGKEVRTICTKPLIRAETHESYINKKGGRSYKVEWLPVEMWDRRDQNDSLFRNKYRRVQAIPCGQCIECRLNYSREWATRAMLEKRYWNADKCWFLTLTYDEEHVPYNEVLDEATGEIITGQSLKKKDMQDFWKRVRKHYKIVTEYKENKPIPGTGMKYINAGEYGSDTLRPHYHAIVYGLPLDTSKLKRIGINQNGDAYYQSPELDKLWGKGYVTVGELTWQSAAYVARYTLKKAKGTTQEILLAMGKKPEYVSMSQGIGKAYFEENLKHIYKSDTVPVMNTKTNQLVKPPKNYDRILKEVDPELYKTIKKKREDQRDTSDRQLLKYTDKNMEEVRKQKEEIIEKSFKDIRKEL